MPDHRGQTPPVIAVTKAPPCLCACHHQYQRHGGCRRVALSKGGMRKHSRWKIVHHGDDRERRLSDVRVGSRGKGVGPGSANRLDAAISVCTEYRNRAGGRSMRFSASPCSVISTLAFASGGWPQTIPRQWLSDRDPYAWTGSAYLAPLGDESGCFRQHALAPGVGGASSGHRTLGSPLSTLSGSKKR